MQNLSETLASYLLLDYFENFVSLVSFATSLLSSQDKYNEVTVSVHRSFPGSAGIFSYIVKKSLYSSLFHPLLIFFSVSLLKNLKML